MKSLATQFRKVFFAVVLLCGILFSSHAKAEGFIVEVFDKDGAAISLSKGEISMLKDSLPGVKAINAYVRDSAYGGGAINLFVSFQTKDGHWKEDAAQINGGMPISWHIISMIKEKEKEKEK